MHVAHGAGSMRRAGAAAICALSVVAAACTDQAGRTTSAGLPTVRATSTTSTTRAPTATVTSALPAPPPGSTWKIAFDDAFSGTALDRSHWATCYPYSSTTCTNASTGELELYTPKNVEVAAGELHLIARREIASGEGKTFAYTSGMVSGASPTRTMFAFRYGYIEARARIAVGAGFWSALWLQPTDRSSLPEVDIFEMVGVQPDNVREYTHWLTPQGEQKFMNEFDLTQAPTGWHVYGLDWEPAALTWYLDGKQVWKMDYLPAVPQVDMFLLANLAVGGPYATPPLPETPFPAALRFDYMRVWQHT